MQAKPSLSLYSFSEMWSPGFFVALFGIAVLYFLLIRKWRDHFAESAPVPKSKQFYFVSALTLYYIVWGSPLKVLGEYSFSMHMVSMTIAYLAVMPLFLLGIPKWFWKPIMHKPFLRKGLRFFTQPLLAVVLFNMLFSFAHFPSLRRYDGTRSLFYNDFRIFHVVGRTYAVAGIAGALLFEKIRFDFGGWRVIDTGLHVAGVFQSSRI